MFARPFLRMNLALVVAIASAFITQAVSGPEFSADVLARESHGKLYVGKSRMRLEMIVPGSSVAGVLITDFESGHVLALMPEQHMYMDYGVVGEASPFGPLTRPVDLARPCAEWSRIGGTSVKGDVLTCKSLGLDTVNNRPAQKWEGRYNGESGYLWVDPAVRFIVKLEGRGEHWELRNIKEGPQPLALFEIPSTYKKFDMGAKPKP
jgi:hypothetical protein